MSANRTLRKPRVRRRDRPGHIDPQHAAQLRKKTSQPPLHKEEAFIAKPISSDPLGEEMGEAFVRQATSGNDDELEEFDREVPEETGGPFVPTTTAEEVGDEPEEAPRRGAKWERS